MAEFALESSAFENAQAIPSRHSCEGEDVSPPLRWSNVPEGTRSLALVADDPDAPGGVFTHWLAWGLDPAAEELGEGDSAPNEGRNDFGTSGYRGPARRRVTGATATSSASMPSMRSRSCPPARRRPSSSRRSKDTCSRSPSSSAPTSAERGE
jgi:Phosphatidylethanolamine-binding protein